MGPIITQTVVATIGKMHDGATIVAEIGALLNYVQHVFATQEVMRQRKQWDEDREAKVNETIARAMKEWDDEHYPRLLHATWGWHPFYPSFIANPLCYAFRPTFPLYHSVVEGSDVHALLLQQSHVQRIYPVPWSVLLLRCFLKYHSLLPPLVSHPSNGSTVANVTEWSNLAQQANGDGSRHWHLATTYLKEEGFLMFAGARAVDSHHQWVAEVDVAFRDLVNGTPTWWAELHMWCNSVQFRAVQDMAFHDKQTWLNVWVIRDRPATFLPPLACYEQWLQHREDLDIGYVLANPGIFWLFQLLHVQQLPRLLPKVFIITIPMCAWSGRHYGPTIGAC